MKKLVRKKNNDLDLEEKEDRVNRILSTKVKKYVARKKNEGQK